jgi:antibiotic biosynthesis monooxygenase (ABM) superfamily enzyme
MSTTQPTATDPIHIVITRRVRPGREAEFQQALREFFQASFGHEGVLGASMLVPPPGSGAREFGILRAFASERERDAFYDSPLFRAWAEHTAPLTEDGWTYRQLHGMEAWFRSPQPPPARWKMALLTWLAVWPVSVAVRALLWPALGSVLPAVLFAGVVAAGIVLVLTWVAMPLLVKAARTWLQPPVHPVLGNERRHRGGHTAA